MVNKLTNSVGSNEPTTQDSASNKVGLKDSEGKTGIKNPRIVKWLIWLIVLAGLIAMFWWMFSPAPSTTSVYNFNITPATTNTQPANTAGATQEAAVAAPAPEGPKAGEFSFQTSADGGWYYIRTDVRGSLEKVSEKDFIYTVQTNRNGWVKFAGVILDAKDGLPHSIYQLTVSGVNSFFYDSWTRLFWVGDRGSIDLVLNKDGTAKNPSGNLPKLDGTPATYNYNTNVSSWQWISGMNTTSYQLSDSGKNIFTSIFISWAPIIIFFVVMMALFRRRGLDADGESVFTIGRSLAKLAKTKVKFTDVAGIAEEKQELIEIVDYLKRPGKYVAMGARIPRGVILYGPPGTGKTLLAKAVAGEAQVPFFQIAGSAFEDMLVGVGAKRIRDMFNKAKKVAPCIIFIDEIDSIGGKRGRSEIAGGNYSISEQTINQLLGEMDGFETKTGIIVIAATNRIDVLDEALLRPGRFDRHIKISLPDIKEREEILILHARNKNFSSKISFADIARRTPGFSGAQLENTLNEAVLLAVRQNRTVILESDVDEAIDRIIAGPAKVSRTMTDTEREQIAFHEAGHALTGLYLKNNEEIQKITIIPRGNAGGYTLSAPKGYETNLKRKSELLDMIAVCLGGRASEEIIFGKDNISSGASDDLYKATNIVRNMVMQLGMSSLGKTQYIPSQGTLTPSSVKLYSDETALAIDKEIDTILNQQYQRSSEIISRNIDELKLIVEALLTVETIVKHDIEFIHTNKRLPDEIVAIKKKSELDKIAKQNGSNEKKEDENNKTNVI